MTTILAGATSTLSLDNILVTLAVSSVSYTAGNLYTLRLHLELRLAATLTHL